VLAALTALESVPENVRDCSRGLEGSASALS
jgi:hypothetical protein